MIILIILGYILSGCFVLLLCQIYEKCEYDNEAMCVVVVLWPVLLVLLLIGVLLPWIVKQIYKIFIFIVFYTISLFTKDKPENQNKENKTSEETVFKSEAQMHCPKCGCQFTENVSNIIANSDNIPHEISVLSTCPSCHEPVCCHARIKLKKYSIQKDGSLKEMF